MRIGEANQAGTTKDGFNATYLTAGAGTGRTVRFLPPRRWRMAPFTRNTVDAGEAAPVNGDAASNPGAENRAEHHRRAGSGAIHRLGEHETVGVVSQRHRARQDPGEIGAEWPPRQPGQIYRPHRARLRIHHSRQPEPYRQALAPDPGFQPGHDVGQRRQGLVIADGCGAARPQALPAGAVEHQRRELGPAHVDADIHGPASRLPRRCAPAPGGG